MDALPYYKWYWIDYRANRKVQRMSWQARGLYRELLDEFWSEGILPTDTTALAEICGCDRTTFLMYWPEIEPCWEQTADGLVNLRMNDQRTEKDHHRVKMAKAGQSGAFAKLKLAKASNCQQKPDKGDSKGVVANASKSHIAGAEQEHKQEQSISKSSPEQIARRVADRTGILTDYAFKALLSVARREINMGMPTEEIAEAMSAAWEAYQVATPDLSSTLGAEKFFGEGKWKDQNSWGWRNNGQFAGKTESSLNGAKAAIQAIEDRHASSQAGDQATGKTGGRRLPSVC